MPMMESAAAYECPIPLEVRRRWMALLVAAVNKAGTLNVNFTDITVSATEVQAHQVKRRIIPDGIEVIKIL